MTPKTLPKSVPETPKKHHHFGTGLALGTLLGITAYYAYGTKTGKKLRREFIKEFEKEKKLIDQHFQENIKPIVEEKTVELKEVVENTKKTESVNRLLGRIKKPKSTKKTTKKSSTKSKTKPTTSKAPKKPKSKKYFTRLGKKMS